MTECLYLFIYVCEYVCICVGMFRCKCRMCFLYLCIFLCPYEGTYVQTQFHNSWDTVQIVNKNRMQWCGSFKFQYYIYFCSQVYTHKKLGNYLLCFYLYLAIHFWMVVWTHYRPGVYEKKKTQGKHLKVSGHFIYQKFFMRMELG